MPLHSTQAINIFLFVSHFHIGLLLVWCVLYTKWCKRTQFKTKAPAYFYIFKTQFIFMHALRHLCSTQRAWVDTNRHIKINGFLCATTLSRFHHFLCCHNFLLYFFDTVKKSFPALRMQGGLNLEKKGCEILCRVWEMYERIENRGSNCIYIRICFCPNSWEV